MFLDIKGKKSQYKRKAKYRLACDFETTSATWDTTKYDTYYMAEKNDAVYTEPQIIQWSVSFFVSFWEHLTKKMRDTIKADDDYEIVRKEWNNKKIVSVVGVKIDTFMSLIFMFSSLKKIDYLFNNLMGFDGSFIEYWASQNLNLLLPFDNLAVVNNKHFNTEIDDKYAETKIIKAFKDLYGSRIKNYQIKDKLNNMNEKQYYEIRRYYNNLVLNEYSVQCDESNKYFSIKIATTGFLAQFKCSYRLWIMSIKKMGEIINLPKLTQDYSDYKILNKPSEIPKNELEYVTRDTEILLLGDTFLCDEFCKITGLTQNDIKLTAPSLAFWTWQNYFLNDLIKLKKIEKIKWHGFYYKWIDTKKMLNKKQMIKDIMKNYFPISKLQYDNIKPSYKGGISKVNEIYRGTLLKCIKYDEKSAYPSVMVSNKSCPYGYIYTKNDDEFKTCKWFYYKIICVKKLHLKRLSVLPITHINKVLEWVQTICVNDEFTINQDKYNWLKKHVKDFKNHFYIEKLYAVKTKPMKFFFGSYINEIYDLKKECDEQLKTEKNIQKISALNTKRAIYKLLIVSVYGKYASKYKHETKFIYDNDYVKLKSESQNIYYLPIGGAITTHAQIALSDGVANQYDKFVYSDTDSITMIKKDFNASHLKIGDDLGDWAIEENEINILVRRPKQYAYFDAKNNIKRGKNGVLNITYAGLTASRISDKLVISKYDFLNGINIEGQLKKDKANFKVFLAETVKQIKPIYSLNYQKLREQKKYQKKHFEIKK